MIEKMMELAVCEKKLKASIIVEGLALAAAAFVLGITVVLYHLIGEQPIYGMWYWRAGVPLSVLFVSITTVAGLFVVNNLLQVHWLEEELDDLDF